MNKSLKELEKEYNALGLVSNGISSKGSVPTFMTSKAVLDGPISSGTISSGILSGDINFQLPPGSYTLGFSQPQEKIFFTIDNVLERVRTVVKKIPCPFIFAIEQEPIIQDTNTSPEDTYQISTGFLIAYFKLERELSNRKFQNGLSTFTIADVRTMALLLLADKYFNKDLLVAMHFVNELEEVVSTYRTANFEFYHVVSTYFKAHKEGKLTPKLFRKMLGVK